MQYYRLFTQEHAAAIILPDSTFVLISLFPQKCFPTFAPQQQIWMHMNIPKSTSLSVRIR